MIAHRHIASADVLLLHTTPQEIIPAPAPSKVIVPVSVYLRCTNVTVAYTVPGTVDLNLNLVSMSMTVPFHFVLLQSLDSNALETVAGPAAELLNAGDMAAAPLMLGTTTGNPTDGDGDLDVWVVYQLVDIA